MTQESQLVLGPQTFHQLCVRSATSDSDCPPPSHAAYPILSTSTLFASPTTSFGYCQSLLVAPLKSSIVWSRAPILVDLGPADEMASSAASAARVTRAMSAASEPLPTRKAKIKVRHHSPCNPFRISVSCRASCALCIRTRSRLNALCHSSSGHTAD
jgi:hypothetical protein